MLHFLKNLKSLVLEIFKMSTRAASVSSFCRYSADLFLVRLGASNRQRQIHLRDNILLTYRLNRGDMESIREVWLDEVYTLPFQPRDVLVDLGANIGLTSVWLAKRFGYTNIVAVEPSPSNCYLARLNLNNNGISAEVIEAAAGPEDMVAYFVDSQASNTGHVGSQGRPIQMLSMKSILDRLPLGTTVDLKMDIEGGEEALLEGDLSWLKRINGMTAEFHPAIMNYPKAIEILKREGLKQLTARAFVRAN